MLYMLYKHYIDPSSDVAVAVALGYDQHNILKEVNCLSIRSLIGSPFRMAAIVIPCEVNRIIYSEIV